MSIEPDITYDALSLSNRTAGQLLWTMTGPISGDCLAGIIVGINILLDYYAHRHRNNDRYELQIRRNGETRSYVNEIRGWLHGLLNNYMTLGNFRQPFGKILPDPDM
jgi:hypothetical protein